MANWQVENSNSSSASVKANYYLSVYYKNNWIGGDIGKVNSITAVYLNYIYVASVRTYAYCMHTVDYECYMSCYIG